MSVRETGPGMAAVEKFLKGFHKEAMIGIPAGSIRTDGVDNAMLGFAHEFGSPKHNLPPRPFLIPGAAEAMPDAMQKLAADLKADMPGEQALTRAATFVANRVKRYIQVNQTSFAKWSDAYAKRRASSNTHGKKGNGASGKILIQSGQMLKSITSVIVDK